MATDPADIYGAMEGALAQGEIGPPEYPIDVIERVVRDYYARPDAPAPPPPGFLDRFAAGLADMPSPGAYGRSGDVFGANLATGFARAFAGNRLGERQRQEGLQRQAHQRKDAEARMLLEHKLKSVQDGYSQRLLTHREAVKAAAEARAKYKPQDVIEGEAYAGEKGRRRAERELPDPVKPEKPDDSWKGHALSLATAMRGDKAIQNFTDIRDGYQRVVTGANAGTPQGDLSLIFGYMKMLDPGSVVREGEYANAANTRGVPDMIRQQYNRVLRGDKLSAPQRVEFKRTAKDLYDAYLPNYRKAIDFYGGQGDALGVPREAFMRDHVTPVDEPAANPWDWLDAKTGGGR